MLAATNFHFNSNRLNLSVYRVSQCFIEEVEIKNSSTNIIKEQRCCYTQEIHKFIGVIHKNLKKLHK